MNERQMIARECCNNSFLSSISSWHIAWGEKLQQSQNIGTLLSLISQKDVLQAQVWPKLSQWVGTSLL